MIVCFNILVTVVDVVVVVTDEGAAADVAGVMMDEGVVVDVAGFMMDEGVVGDVIELGTDEGAVEDVAGVMMDEGGVIDTGSEDIVESEDVLLLLDMVVVDIEFPILDVVADFGFESLDAIVDINGEVEFFVSFCENVVESCYIAEVLV